MPHKKGGEKFCLTAKYATKKPVKEMNTANFTQKHTRTLQKNTRLGRKLSTLPGTII
jgi:hypothetical protein